MTTSTDSTLPPETDTADFLVAVAPLTRIPLTRDQSFFYRLASSKPVPLGSRVEIPIGRRTVHGIVTACNADFAHAGGIELKRVRSILIPSELTPNQLALAYFISTHYYTPLGIVLKLFIRDKKSAKNKQPITPLAHLEPITLNASTRDAVEKMMTTCSTQHKEKSRHTLHTMCNAESRIVLAEIIQRQFAKKTHHPAQVLILVPERCHISFLEQALTKYFPGDVITTYAGTQTGGAQSESWERIRSGDASIIIGSRSAICAPFANLSLILTWSSHSTTHKQWEKHPRFDARMCADELARIDNKISHIAITPQPELQPRGISPHSISLPAQTKPKVELVDMKIEYNEINEKRYKKSRPAISRALTAHITRALKSGRQVLLFVGRSGTNAFSVCEKCRSVARCPQCERALTESSRGYHRCHHCPFKTDVFPSCVGCRNLTFQSVGLGTERIEQDIKKIFPSAHIARADRETMKTRTAPTKLAQALTHDDPRKRIDILIGTQMMAGSINIPHLSVCAIIDMDDLLASYDYDAHERATARVTDIMQLCALSQNSHTTLVIQAFDTLHSVVQDFATGTSPTKLLTQLRDTASEDLMSRSILSLPPYSELMVIDIACSTRTKCDAIASEIYEKLIAACSSERHVVISEPYTPLVPKIRTMHKAKILLKIKKGLSESYAVIPESLDNILRDLPKEAKVDRNPVSIA